MSDREQTCWIVGSVIALFGLLTGVFTYNNIKVATIKLEATTVKAEARVQVAQEINRGLTNLGKIWQR